MRASEETAAKRLNREEDLYGFCDVAMLRTSRDDSGKINGKALSLLTCKLSAK